MTTDIGFTGTQVGMSDFQKETLRELLEAIRQTAGRFHHGDCIGADAEAHQIAREVGYDCVIHPPLIATKRAFCSDAEVLPEKEYRDRNQAIVDATMILIAAPRTDHEQRRSGTWQTVRYAGRCQREVIVLLRTQQEGTTK